MWFTDEGNQGTMPAIGKVTLAWVIRWAPPPTRRLRRVR